MERDEYIVSLLYCLNRRGFQGGLQGAPRKQIDDDAMVGGRSQHGWVLLSYGPTLEGAFLLSSQGWQSRRPVEGLLGCAVLRRREDLDEACRGAIIGDG